MSRIQVGTTVKELSLPGLDGDFDLAQITGKRYMLAFHRFAACPFCNLRIHQLVTRYNELPENFTIVAIFDSPLDNLQKHTTGHHAPFAILADEENTYYRKFAVEHSVSRIVIGGILRLPTVLYAMFVKGYLPLSFKGSITTLPLELLVDENHVVRFAHYGKDEGDHLPFDVIKHFSEKGLIPKNPDIA